MSRNARKSRESPQRASLHISYEPYYKINECIAHEGDHDGNDVEVNDLLPVVDLVRISSCKDDLDSADHHEEDGKCRDSDDKESYDRIEEILQILCGSAPIFIIRSGEALRVDHEILFRGIVHITALSMSDSYAEAQKRSHVCHRQQSLHCAAI